MDELSLVRDGRPQVAPPTARVVDSARSELMDSIKQANPNGERRRRRLLARAAVASVGILATAAAAWAVIPQGGNLATPPFSGATWALTVGEESNGDGTFKVCRSFSPAGEKLQMGNSLGGSGCETSPVEVPTDGVITDVIRAFDTPTGVVVLVDLTKDTVSTVTVETDSGESHEVAPFAMPESGEKFVAVEVTNTATEISVSAYNRDGKRIDGHVLKLGESP